MKKLITILTLTLTLTLPKITLAQDLKQCPVNQKYLGNINNGVLCLYEKNKKTFHFLKYRSYLNAPYLSISLTITIINNNQKEVHINDDKYGIFKSTTFILEGRKFKKWVRNPNISLIEKNRYEISAMLNAIERYQNPTNITF